MARIFQRRNKWFIDYFANGKRYREIIGPSRRDAERCLAKRQTEIAEGRFLNIRQRCALTLDEFAPRYMKWAETHKRSWKRDGYSLGHLQKYMGRKNLERITVGDVDKYKRARLAGEPKRRPPTPSTINRELACFRKVLSLAVDLGVLAENHLAGKIKLYAEPEGRVRYLEPAEAKRLLAECAEHFRPIASLALLTGMRRGELLGLTWDEVSLERGTVRLPGARCKNGRARTIPLNMEARGVLARARRARVEGCALVFHRQGRPIRDIRGAFEGACRRAGLKDFRFHDLRHSFASALAMGGVPLQVIGELLGHRTLSMTQRYAHLSPQVLQGAVEQASSYLATMKPANVETIPLYSNEAHRATG